MCPAGNTDAMQLLGGLLSVLPERVTKTMDAHREAITKKVRGRAFGCVFVGGCIQWAERRLGKIQHKMAICVWCWGVGVAGGETGSRGYMATRVGCSMRFLQQLVGWQASGI